MNELAKTSASQDRAAVRGFVTSYAKCWEHYEAYMQNPDNTYKGFIAACRQEAKEQGIEIQLPADTTFRNRTARLVQADVIPKRTQSDNPEAVKKRKQREKGTNAQIGQMSRPQPAQPATVPEGTTETNTPPLISNDKSTEQSAAVVCEVVEDDRIESVLPRYDSEDSESDYQRALELLAECSRIVDKHIRYNSWHESKFDELHGELTVMRDGIEPSCSDYKKSSRRFRAEREAVAPGAAW